MIIPYTDYEKQVYEGLYTYRGNHPGFSFSVRLNGSKGSELDYFIGTSKSKYFGFTCWLVPVYFPGSSSDLVDFFFNYGNDGRIGFWFEASAPKAVSDLQLVACKAFVESFRKVAGEKGHRVGPNPEEKKFIDCFLYPEPRLFDSFEALWAAFIPFMEMCIELVDHAMARTHEAYPDWQAEPITNEKFNDFLQRMQRRFERYSHLRQSASVTLPPAEEALKEAEDQQVKAQSLNQILYGPPGTGKTYHTVNKAIEIIDPIYYRQNQHSRKALLKKFNELLITDWAQPGGQIAFTTFHQSMTYEDFVEGIKPVVDEQDIGTHANSIRYEIKDGLFKLMTQKASWKKGNLESVLEKFKQACDETAGKSPIMIKAAYTSFDVTYRGTAVFYVSPHNSVKETKPWYPVNIENIRKAYEMGNTQGLYNPTYIREILNHLTKSEGLKTPGKSTDNQPPHVLIIDEINRGNIAQIFGELITLLETAKRAGREEHLEAMLTYSKQPFSVPDNLYVVGTMNTADRSVEALDAALRRRFSFQEMLPDPSLLSPYALLAKFHERNDAISWEKWANGQAQHAKDFYAFTGLPDWEISGEEERALYEMISGQHFDATTAAGYLREYDLEPEIRLDHLLSEINKRVEVLYDREHTIGHSFFFKVIGDDHPLTALRQVFKEEIIPLLQEYFFGDYAKIGLVLGKDFILNKYPERLKSVFFAEFPLANIEDYVRPVYEINQKVLTDNDSFRKALLHLMRKTENTAAHEPAQTTEGI